MKKLLLISLTAISILGCNKIQEISFSKSVVSGSFIIEADYCCGVDNDCDLIVDINQIAKDNNVSLENIKSITIKNAKLKSLDDDCDDISSINITSIRNNGNNIELLSKENTNPNGATFLDLDVKSDANLLDYLKETAPKFKVKGLIKEKSNIDRRYEVEIEYKMTAKK